MLNICSNKNILMLNQLNQSQTILLDSESQLKFSVQSQYLQSLQQDCVTTLQHKQLTIYRSEGTRFGN